VGSAGSAATLPSVSPYSARDTLLEEKLALGYCFSGSLFDNVAHEVRRFAATPLSRAMPTKDPIWIAGVVTNSRAQMTRRGMMRVIELDDGSGRMEVTVFNELYDARKHVLKVDDVLIISAKIDNDEYSGGLRGSAVEILTLLESRGRFARVFKVHLPSNLPPPFVSDLRGFFANQNTGSSAKRIPVVISVETQNQSCEMQIPQKFAVVPDENFMEKIRRFEGIDCSLEFPE
jgi:DNA polymerase-3 subunit alpha